jgi:hypothetical protein
MAYRFAWKSLAKSKALSAASSESLDPSTATKILENAGFSLDILISIGVKN